MMKKAPEEATGAKEEKDEAKKARRGKQFFSLSTFEEDETPWLLFVLRGYACRVYLSETFRKDTKKIKGFYEKAKPIKIALTLLLRRVVSQVL
jgi:hypothetical protein